jgi:protein tyrosine phosphatase (PTP) superfamily phosphohydrolase (DUF442 family)
MAMNFAKRHRRSVVTVYRRYRNRVAGREGARVRPQFARFLEHFDLLVIDHGIFRRAYLNFHEVAPGVWRSAQPGPRDIRRLSKRGLRTVINLRGIRDCGSFRLEQQACEKYRIRLINFKMRSRGVPERQTIHDLAALFRNIEYPVLIHCKSGADRAGLMSALYLLVHEGRPLDEAIRQLSLRYGHFKQADTGVLDHFLECYRADAARAPMHFMTWAETHYDPVAVRASFKPRGAMNVLVNGLLKRE